MSGVPPSPEGSQRLPSIAGGAVLKLLTVAFSLLAVAVAAYVAYLYATYLDETVRSGSAYGFRIGQSKAEAFAIAARQFSAGEISGVHTSEPFATLDPVEGAFARLAHVDAWVLFPGERDDFLDVVKLEFEDGSLKSIHRHHRRFELP